MPKLFNGNYICWLRGPWHKFKSSVLEPFLGLLALVFGVIGLLEEDIRWLFLVILDWFLRFIIQNAHEKLSIHPSINSGYMLRSFPGHRAPDHRKTSSKLDCPLYKPITQSLSWHFPHPFLPHLTPNDWFWFHLTNNPFIVLHCPVFVCLCKVPVLSSPYGWREVHGQNFAQHANIMWSFDIYVYVLLIFSVFICMYLLYFIGIYTFRDQNNESRAKKQGQLVMLWTWGAAYY